LLLYALNQRINSMRSTPLLQLKPRTGAIRPVKCLSLILWFCSVPFFVPNDLNAQNPIILDQFTADPSARVFGEKVYVYPSHDILADENRGRIGWFCMEDYHVFSSPNLIEWTDHGIIISQNQVPWVDSLAYGMWAPDCIERNGKYYFYFPSRPKDAGQFRGFSIGVAVSENPEGPFTPQEKAMNDVHGIDPNPFVDKDGRPYLYWAMKNIYVARLNENMLELDSEPMIIENLPPEGLKEGPFVFERNGIYYLTYPHAENKTERLEYAIADNPLGPFKVSGILMDELPSGCWTNHQSILEFKDQWYLFYHDNDLSPKFDKNRSVRIDSMFFNDDGTIRKVIPTLRGVGISPATDKIEIDRYSRISDTGASVVFMDTLNTFAGWKAVFDSGEAWIQYNAVDFSGKKVKSVHVKAMSGAGGTLLIRLNRPDGPLVAEVHVPKGTEWTTVKKCRIKIEPGVHNLIVTLKDKGPVEVDWIRFEK
jgi:hypothetical protein